MYLSVGTASASFAPPDTENSDAAVRQGYQLATHLCPLCECERLRTAQCEG